MTDYNVRDVFFLFTGRCGHKWVAQFGRECPVCGDEDHWDPAGDSPPRCVNVVAYEPIAVDFFPHSETLGKVQRRIKRAIRENRRKPRKSAAVISLADHRPQPNA